MRRFATIAIVLGIVGGLLGMVAFSGLSGTARATGSVTEQTEVTLLAEQQALSATPGQPYDSLWEAASINTAKFPAGTTFTFNVGGRESAYNSHCFRLAEVIPPSTVNPVSESEVCTTVSDSDNYFALQSGALTLSSGDHIYLAEWKQQGSGLGHVYLGTVRVLAEWQDYSPPVGGIALLPNISDSSPSNYIALAALAGLALVALSGGARYAKRRWGR